MKFYCGIDLHARDSFVCVIDDRDKIHLKEKLSNQLVHFLYHLNEFSPRPSVVVESTLNWYWLVDGLKDAGFEVTLAHTLGLHMIKGAKVKTDKRDAFNLARLLRLEAIPKAYIYPKEKRPIRDLLRRRSRLVRLRAAEYSDIRRVLYQHGILSHSKAEIKHLDEGQISEYFEHPILQCNSLLQLERVDFYTRQIKTLEKTILGTVEDELAFELLTTIPGVGKILALTIFYETGEINRFPSPKHYSSYSRVVPGIAQSGNTTKKGRGSKQGNPHLKWAFTQAAVFAIRYYGPIRKFRQAHMERRKSRARKLISISIVAHKLAIATYWILKNQVPFDEELMFGSYL
jgi:transposase